VVLSEFVDSSETAVSKLPRIDLHIDLVGGGSVDKLLFGPGDPALSYLGNKAWTLDFSGVGGLSSTDVLSSFFIRAREPLGNTSGTAEHFLISGFNATIRETQPPDPGPAPIPLPSAIWGGLGLLAALGAHRASRNRWPARR